MSLSTYYLEYGSHLARLHRCRCRRAYAPTSNTASHDNHEKINSWVSFCFPYEYGAPLGGPSGRQSSAITFWGRIKANMYENYLYIPGGGTPRKIGWGCAARFPKPLPYLWPKSAIFPTLFMTWPKIRNPIYDPTLTSKSCFRPAF